MLLAAGTQLGPYKIVAPLGAGGMGEVYKARDTRLDRIVAIKILPADLAADVHRRERFRREARAISSLTHPHICTLHDVGEQDGVDFLVMEYLPGETLAHRLLRGALPLEDVLRIAVQLADALDAAHRAGLTHRDLKPANVMLTAGGAKVLDFGLAKWHTNDADSRISVAEAAVTGHPTLTQVGAVVGTIQYMAPEQVEGRSADARSDLFALGAIIYEMTTGRKAFEGTSAPSVMAAILTSEPKPMTTLQPITPRDLERVVKKCLAKDPLRRWQNAADLRDDLAWIEEDRGAPVAPPRASDVAWTAKTPRRRRVLSVLGFGAALAVSSMMFVVGQRSMARTAAPGEQLIPPVFRPLTFRRGVVQSARFAPDRQTIVYSASWDGGPLELFTTRTDSAEARSLGLPSASIQAISRTGDLALLLGCSRQLECEGTLARAPLAGGAARELLEHVRSADWDPVRLELAVIHHLDQNFQLEYPIGHVLYAPPPGIALGKVRFSHVGTKLAFLETVGDGANHVSVIDLEGHKRTILSGIYNIVTGLEWSPRDDEIWFSRSTSDAPPSLYATTMGGVPRLIERMPQAMTLLDLEPNGSVLAMTSTPRWYRIVGHAATEREERDLSMLNNPELGDLSRDGTTVLFNDSAYGVPQGIYLRKMDGSPAVRLGPGTDAFSLSPDGKWAATMNAPPNNVVLLPTGPGKSRTLPLGPLEDMNRVLWLPDGRRLILGGHESKRASRTYVQDIDGAMPRPLTPEHIEPLLVSPDGGSVLASGSDRARTLAIYPIGGAAPQPVLGLDPGDAPVQWSADGLSLFVREPGDYPARVFRFDLRSRRKSLWKELLPADAAGLVSVALQGSPSQLLITPDGRTYVYRYFRALSDLFLVEGLR